MRKENKKYYFTVEGETEQWYLKWLQSAINAEKVSLYTVTLDCPIQKDPLKRAKSLSSLNKTEITHIFDYESNDEVHTTQFRTTLDRMKEAQSPKVGKRIRYLLDYSNFTFELWNIFHKIGGNCLLTNRSQYLTSINHAYGEHFENLKQYKHEAAFKRIIKKLTLNDVQDAIKRAKIIMKKNAENGLVPQQYKGYQYYIENPSLSIWETIEKMLKECNLQSFR